MSTTADRIPLAAAQAVVNMLMERWCMTPGECEAVGSIRRGRDDVGDIDLIAPLPAKEQTDWLYQSIDKCCPAKGGLFAAADAWCRPIKGLKPYFVQADLEVSVRISGRPVKANVTVWRYVPGPKGNRGWVLLQRTGPGDFGKWVLGAWKYRRGIRGDAKGSETFLLDAFGHQVATPDEASIFTVLRVPFIEPADRDRWIVERQRRQQMSQEHLR